MRNLFSAAIWLAIMVFIYITGYLLNKKTPKPKGCENLTADCEGCQAFDCSHNPAHHKEDAR